MKLYVSHLSALLLPALLLIGLPAAADTQAMTKETPASESQVCDFNLDFSNETEIANWRVLLDGVMGGRSTGTRYAEDGHMAFKGRINTDGGGFSSMRRPMQRGALKDVDSLKLRLKTDGRAYKLTFRTNANYWRRPISYQLDIPQTPKGEWADVNLPLSGFRTSVFGRNVPAAPFDSMQVREMGIILADGIDGPFEIYLKSIACR